MHTSQELHDLDEGVRATRASEQRRDFSVLVVLQRLSGLAAVLHKSPKRTDRSSAREPQRRGFCFSLCPEAVAATVKNLDTSLNSYLSF